ncbi:helix-turn-helix domain-containing protein [Streptomyces sp. NPDC088190]|uniref:helix-turn-helix domain-containing protein n=1 Tax=unclassified Streptomyces TaxID=2593676 RepID=UPI002E7A8BB6|nr:helix-turn-helix domain-containing protein [Streptomyces sp. JV190]MEE1844174.1 helix-turn-helix domain-containing protein [Streptomyces sp. JV190]
MRHAAIPHAYVQTPHPDTAPPRLYLPEDVAAALGCSAWWVKDRARRRLIPHTRVGRSYRFTGEHLAEIIRMHEALPAVPQQPTPPAASIAPRPASSSTPPVPVTRLRARPPRRAGQGQFGTAA